MPLFLSAGILLAFFIAGDPLLRWLLPSQPMNRAQHFILAAWLGLAFYVLILCNLYFLASMLTVQRLAWPLISIVLLAALASAVLRPRFRPAPMDSLSWASLLIPCLAVLLLTVPLLDLDHLGFYFSNNGEFANYAAIGDIVQYHPSGTEIHWLSPIQTWYPLACREAVVGLLAALASALTGHPTLWVIQPLSWVLAWIALASLGLLVREVALRYQALPASRCFLVVLYAWAGLSASSQRYWTFSWMSQYLSLSLFYGSLLCLVAYNGKATSGPSLIGKSLVVGLGLAALASAYPELFIANLLMLLGVATFMGLGKGQRHLMDALLPLGLGSVWAAVLGNKFTSGVLLARFHVSSALPIGWWNVYGDHVQPLHYLASLLGLTNIFLGGGPNTMHAALAAVGLGLAFLIAGRQGLFGKEPVLRGLGAGSLALGAGAAWLFLQVHRHGGSNYPVTKFILQFEAFAYLSVAMLLASLRRKPLLLAAALVMAVLSRDLARTGYKFARHLREDSRAALFTEADGRECRQALGPDPSVYIAAPAYHENFKIIGKYLAYDRDLFSHNGSWPANDARPYDASQTVILIGRKSVPSDDKSLPKNLVPVFSGPGYSILRSKTK